MAFPDNSPFGLLPGMRPGTGPGMRGGNAAPIIAGGAVVLLLLLVWLFRPFTIVDGGYVGVKTFFGAPETEMLRSGFHFIVPVAEVVYEGFQSISPSTRPRRSTSGKTTGTSRR